MAVITTHEVLGTQIWVVDDFISAGYRALIKDDVDPKRLPIQLLSSSAYYDQEYIPAAESQVFNAGGVIHGSYWYLYPMLMEAAHAVGKRITELLRIRIGVYFSNGLGISTKNQGHFDRLDPHIIGLYYPDDCDGDTYVYAAENSKDIVFQNSPKAGRIIFMDGALWHSSSNPVAKSLRTTINFNFRWEDGNS